MRHHQRKKDSFLKNILCLLKLGNIIKGDFRAGVNNLPFKHLNQIGIRTISIWVNRLEKGFFLFFSSFTIWVFCSIQPRFRALSSFNSTFVFVGGCRGIIAFLRLSFFGGNRFFFRPNDIFSGLKLSLPLFSFLSFEPLPIPNFLFLFVVDLVILMDCLFFEGGVRYIHIEIVEVVRWVVLVEISL